MTPGRRLLVPVCLVLISAAPALAEDLTADQAEARLRACVVSGATNAPHESLQAAVIAVRALCGAQLNRVYRNSDAASDAASAGLGETERAERRASARRQIDLKVARLVASATGHGQ